MQRTMLLSTDTASGERSACSSCSNVMVACSASSHLPPFVMRFADSSAASLSPTVAGAPQNTAMRPEHELLVTCKHQPATQWCSAIG